ncbi:leucine-rich repeat LGI family member 2-like [Oreochromis aureus]|uniref:leucine-rich repeat LGI family member 2-like n=1 Tax=Oreochromis aureus TaxID=47969 RepID=UPI0019542D49|nr:leucine-rich repeat LGI family member 2-like [Oreochromis aureus]XP_039466004.1 leucine-rich repeat LGI family member 2-like [Oreochromis aureus]
MFLSTDFILHQSVASESLSVDTFSYKNDVYVAISAPSTESCMIFQWDHIEMNFRTYDNITGQSIVGCKSVIMENEVFVIVAQLFGGSHIYKFDDEQSRFKEKGPYKLLNIHTFIVFTHKLERGQDVS